MAAKKIVSKAETKAKLEKKLDDLAIKMEAARGPAYDYKQKPEVQHAAYEKFSNLCDAFDKVERQLEDLNKTPKQLELEAKFQAALKETRKQAEVHLKAAQAELSKALKLADKAGIPIESSLSETYNTYVPRSFKTKWKKKLSESFLESLMDAGELAEYEEDEEYGGWTKSYC